MPLPGVRRLCGARCTDGSDCTGASMENGRCWRHGGNTPSGLASPHFIHGRRSKKLPARLNESYEEAARSRPGVLQQ
jgi:hypothetical protein